jgi:hypothetical protein
VTLKVIEIVRFTHNLSGARRKLIALALIQTVAVLLIACSTVPDLQDEPPPPTPSNIGLRERMQQTKEHNKLVIDQDVVVWYIPCEPQPASWVAPMIVYHLPSQSSIYLNNDGSLKTSPRPRYESDEGRERLETILSDDAMMERIVSRSPKSVRCPPGSTVIGSE